MKIGSQSDSSLRKIAPKIGEICHCYVPRQKTMRLLGRWPCVRIETITIDYRHRAQAYAPPEPFRQNDYIVRIAGERLSRDECDLLAWRDGFRHPALIEPDGAPSREGLGYGGCFQLMIDFWKGRLPFRGQIIHWYWQRVKEKVVMLLTQKDRRDLIRLLGVLEDYLESEIECSVVAGTNEAATPEAQRSVALARSRCRDAYDWVVRLSKARA